MDDLTPEQLEWLEQLAAELRPLLEAVLVEALTCPFPPDDGGTCTGS